MLRAELSKEYLKAIWDLSDSDRDGQLTRLEFTTAMYLINRAKEARLEAPTWRPADAVRCGAVRCVAGCSIPRGHETRRRRGNPRALAVLFRVV